jgi:hypothetical protein
MSLKGRKTMDRYKVRGKRDDGVWVYGYYCQRYLPIGEMSILQYGIQEVNEEGYIIFHAVDTNTLGRLVGYSRYGDEIYEGDILLIDGNIVVIKIGECCAALLSHVLDEVLGVKIQKLFQLQAYNEKGEYLIKDTDLIKILGNVYDKEENKHGFSQY